MEDDEDAPAGSRRTISTVLTGTVTSGRQAKKKVALLPSGQMHKKHMVRFGSRDSARRVFQARIALWSGEARSVGVGRRDVGVRGKYIGCVLFVTGFHEHDPTRDMFS